VDDQRLTELETAIADGGALLVRIQKYRRGTTPEAAAVVRDALAVGDAARRLHHRAALDASALDRLLAEAGTIVGRLRGLLAAVHGAPEYRTAVAARAAGDQATLARVLPEVFAGLEPLSPVPDLYVPVAWRSRGRPRAGAELASDVAAIGTRGLPAEGDDLSPGTDPLLGAVALADVPPDDEPVLLRLPVGTVALPVYRHADTGACLIYVDALRTPVVVRLATEPGTEQLRVVFDWPAWRAELVDALETAGIPTDPSHGSGRRGAARVRRP
jgi:hypothetical protein